jgi:hypothetical protein
MTNAPLGGEALSSKGKQECGQRPFIRKTRTCAIPITSTRPWHFGRRRDRLTIADLIDDLPTAVLREIAELGGGR